MGLVQVRYGDIEFAGGLGSAYYKPCVLNKQRDPVDATIGALP
jgi:hypothetical protein